MSKTFITWHKGPLNAAIEKTIADKCVLFIFIKGSAADEQTVTYEEILSTLDLRKKSYVAISIEAGSDDYVHILEMYRVAPVPSIMIVDWKTGMLLKRIAGPIFEEDQKNALIGLISEKVNEPIIDMESIGPPRAKIQLKLNSGGTKTQVFAPADSLGLLRSETATIFNLQQPFQLAVAYPRVSLTRDMDSLTLEELGLFPSAVIIVTPQETSLAPNILQNYLWRWFQPLLDYLSRCWRRVFYRNSPTPVPISSQNKRK